MMCRTSVTRCRLIEQQAAHHGLEIVRWYRLDGISAWKDNGECKAMVRQMLDAAYRGEFRVVVVWAADRICRSGIEELLRLLRELRERHCTLMSVQEPWLNGSDATTELLAAVSAWVAQQESSRRSERTRAGMARARAEGRQVGGRKAGAKDRKPSARVNRSAGVRAAWSGPGGAARRAALGDRNRARAAAS